MKQVPIVKRPPEKGWLQRALPALSVIAVAVTGAVLLMISHAATLACATVTDTNNNKISFQICPIATNSTVASQVTAHSSFFGIVPAKSLLSIQQCDSAGNNCANVVTTTGDYTDNGSANYSLLSTAAPVASGHMYKVCAFVADSTGWSGGACSPAAASSVLLAASAAPTAQTATGARTGTPATAATTDPATSATSPVLTTAPAPKTPTTTPSQTAAAAAAAAAAQKAATLIRFYTGIQQQQQQASAFLTALNNMCPAPQPLMSAGASGGCVKFLQFYLNVKNSAGLIVDGQFGPATQAAVMNFQRDHGLSVDGVVGTQTWTYLTSGQFVPISQPERTVSQITTSGSTSGTAYSGRSSTPPPSSSTAPHAQLVMQGDYFVGMPGITVMGNPSCQPPQTLISGHLLAVRPPVSS